MSVQPACPAGRTAASGVRALVLTSAMAIAGAAFAQSTTQTSPSGANPPGTTTPGMTNSGAASPTTNTPGAQMPGTSMPGSNPTSMNTPNPGAAASGGTTAGTGASSSGSNATGATGSAANPASPGMTGTVTGAIGNAVTGMFYTQPAGSTNSWTTAQAVGQSVYNRAGERIGEVDELLIDNTGKVSAVIIGVGGFLGLGERKVAVNFSSLEMTREGNGNPRMVVDLDKTTLREAPEYRVTGNRS